MPDVIAPVLDSFTQANGPLSANWTSPVPFSGSQAAEVNGNTFKANAAQVNGGGFWNPIAIAGPCQMRFTYQGTAVAGDNHYINFGFGSNLSAFNNAGGNLPYYGWFFDLNPICVRGAATVLESDCYAGILNKWYYAGASATGVDNQGHASPLQAGEIVTVTWLSPQIIMEAGSLTARRTIGVWDDGTNVRHQAGQANGKVPKDMAFNAFIGVSSNSAGDVATLALDDFGFCALGASAIETRATFANLMRESRLPVGR